jgi:hypothetical protein
MGFLLAGVIIVCLVGYVFFMLRPRSESPETARPDAVTACPVRLTVLGAAPFALDPRQLSADYQALWDEPLTCTVLGSPLASVTEYYLSNGQAQLWLTVEDAPMSRGDVAMLEVTSPALQAEDREALREHAAMAVLHHRHPQEYNPALSQFKVKVLHALLQDEQAIGYTAVSALRYVPRAELARVCAAHDPLAPAALFLLFANLMRETTEDGLPWLHTHGLEQFGLPELHLIAEPDDDLDACDALLTDTVVYGLTNGPVFHPGQVAELVGDETCFEFRRLANGARGHDGLYGMLLLAKLPPALAHVS